MLGRFGEALIGGGLVEVTVGDRVVEALADLRDHLVDHRLRVDALGGGDLRQRGAVAQLLAQLLGVEAEEVGQRLRHHAGATPEDATRPAAVMPRPRPIAELAELAGLEALPPLRHPRFQIAEIEVTEVEVAELEVAEVEVGQLPGAGIEVVEVDAVVGQPRLGAVEQAAGQVLGDRVGLLRVDHSLVDERLQLLAQRLRRVLLGVLEQVLGRRRFLVGLDGLLGRRRVRRRARQVRHTEHEPGGGATQQADGEPGGEPAAAAPGCVVRGRRRLDGGFVLVGHDAIIHDAGKTGVKICSANGQEPIMISGAAEAATTRHRALRTVHRDRRPAA